MNEAPVLEQAASRLLELLQEALIPSVLHSQDAIQITFPNSQQDYRLGIFLYDLEEVRPYGTPPSIRISDTQRQGPNRTFALRFLVYANRKVPFDGMTALDEMLLLEAVMRAVHNFAPVELGDETVTIQFDRLTRQEKATLWQSLSSPLQPAVYLVMEPLVVPSTKLERLIPVRQVQIKSGRKKEDTPR